MDPHHEHRYTNRLARERSPYLLQHAHNPVDWFPWGEEAFGEARARNVPIFLSVGYSTCYWCHVMERESFENAQIAAVMNSHFVCVKVDREERPDIDDLYMTATQAMTESGGWPMSVFIEPKTLKPFWCGTYFPPEPRWGRPSFPQLLTGIAEAWNTQRDEIVQQADELAEAVKERLGGRSAPLRIGERQVAQAVGQLFKLYDRVNAGFGEAPKFPQPVYLELLLRFRPHAGDDETSAATDAAIRHTLDRMALGGIFDQVGGGFHRYSVDAKWLVPHFEKMLYDNAQLASVYARAASLYNDDFYKRTLTRTLDYVLREMCSPDGAFFSAQDAEVNHREGQNYLWTPEQIRAALDPADAAFAIDVYGLADGPNFRDPHHPQEPASNVLFLRDRPEALARSLNTSEADFLARLDRVNRSLYDARARRDQPGRDEKILAGWNGLMIGALARAGAALNRPDYLDAARRAAEFIDTSMRDDAGALLRSYRRLETLAGAHIPAFLEDYAMVIHGLIEIHLAGADADGAFLARALDLLADAERTFGDPRTGAYYDTRADQEDLFVRARSQHDGAIPCGSSVMLNNLLDLAGITKDTRHVERAARCLASLSAFVAATPIGAVNSTRGLLRLLTDHPETLQTTFRDAPHPPDAASGKTPDESQPVAVYAAVERVTVSTDKPAMLLLQLRVRDGYHVNAADPGPAGGDLIGLRIKIINGTGVAAYADYPQGDAYKPEWAPDAEEIRVYRGVLSIPVVLEREGDITGTPLLAVTYQACTDEACLAPGIVELSVAIDVED